MGKANKKILIFECCSLCMDRHHALEEIVTIEKNGWSLNTFRIIGKHVRNIFKCCGFRNQMGLYLYDIIDSIQHYLNKKNAHTNIMDIRKHFTKIRIQLDAYKAEAQTGTWNQKLLTKIIAKFGLIGDDRYEGHIKKYKKKIARKYELQKLKEQVIKLSSHVSDTLHKDLVAEIKKLEALHIKDQAEIKELQTRLVSSQQSLSSNDVAIYVDTIATDLDQLKEENKKLRAERAALQQLIK